LFYLPPNQKRLLSSLNPLFFIGAVGFFIMLRTAAIPLWPGLFKQWDILLPFAVYYGQRRSVPEGLILALFSGHLYSLCSGAPIGVFTTTYLILFVAARLITYGLYANTGLSIFLLLLGLSVFSRVCLTIVSRSFGQGWPFFTTDNWVLWALVLNAMLGWVVYYLLEFLDKITFKAEITNIELGGESR
jgi:hypothetical protein